MNADCTATGENPTRPELRLAFRLPVTGWPGAVFEGDYSYEGGRLLVDGTEVVRAANRGALEHGLDATLPDSVTTIHLQLVRWDGVPTIEITADGRPALREDALRARPSRSAWTHACLALAGSGAGFIASYLYLLKANAQQSDWALKMGNHMAGWHLLLTFTLFPASVWGQRTGIRVVQWMSLLFFLIHAGIAIANLLPSDTTNPDDPVIAAFNAVSGLLFLIAAVYGNRAYRDMDPVAALREGRLKRET